ncbi:hypothetical protein EV383_5262 [Pseudonocardia sediminis]|uniref:Uncharacterized protein n=1 Tax=Pseudonocardia sediminis TaxID=1397368 RepID=A0A4Q7V6B4_PSEST|nr:hypothetical protein [Pseudonocardia sediminis]RZT88323.1 hypothetical protein EV383_5262 [Pseudonocardia sediminis]
MDPVTRWAHAVSLGGRGHYAAAATVLDGLRTGHRVPPAVRAHAAITRAAHLRQLGAHRLAAALDGRGLHLARLAHPAPEPGTPRPGTPRPGAPRPGAPSSEVLAADAVADALVGLAADAVGRWDAAAAGRLLDRAEPWCAGGGRPAVRWHWVRAETALLSDDPSAAVRAGDDAVRASGELGSERHLLKSRLVRAVARSVAGRAVTAAASGPVSSPDGDGDGLPELDRIAEEAGATGLLPLRWAALLAAADAAEAGPSTGGTGEAPGAAAGGGAHGAERGGRVEPDGDPTRSGTPVRPNERHARTSRSNTLSRQTDAQRRRHAAAATLNVIYLRTDPLGRRSLRESAWIPARIAVPY